MQLKGFQAKRTGVFRSRPGDPARDLDLYGNPVPTNYAVIVRLDECRIWDCADPACGDLPKWGGQHQHYSAKDAPQATPLAYCGTWYGYAEWRMTGNDGWWRPVLFVKDGDVYKSRFKAEQPPEHERIRLFGKGIIVGKDQILA